MSLRAAAAMIRESSLEKVKAAIGVCDSKISVQLLLSRSTRRNAASKLRG
jgi:hypothetical protein